MDTWVLECLDSIGIACWGVVDTTIEDEGENIVAMVNTGVDIQKGKEVAALISTAPELLSLCKRVLSSCEVDNALKADLEYCINKATGKEGDLEILNYYDDEVFLEDEAVMNVDVDAGLYSFDEETPTVKLFQFVQLFTDGGLLTLNIDGDIENEEFVNGFLYPIVTHFFSKKTYKDFVNFVSSKYPTLRDIVDAMVSAEIALPTLINDIFENEFKDKFRRVMTLAEYRELYPFIVDSDELYLHYDVIKSLQDCSYAVHTDTIVTYKGQSVKGILYLRDEEKDFFVLNTEDSSASFCVIPNNDEAVDEAVLEFVDLLQKPLKN